MALQLLGLPPPRQPHPSLAFPKSPILPCFGLEISSARHRGKALVSCQRFSSLIVSSTTEAAAVVAAAAEEEEEEEEGESVESPAEPRRRLIAQNVPWTCTAEDIRSLFERHGAVVDVELSMYSKVRNRGLAFITMASEEDALAALNNLNSYDLDGRVIKVDFSRSLKKNPSPATAVPVEKYGVFVGNLAWRVRSRDLRELFNANGNVVSADVIFQTEPRRSAGYGFVFFSSKEAAEAAIATFNGKTLMGRSIRLMLKGSQTGDAEGKSTDSEQLDEVSSEVTAGDDFSMNAVET